MYAGKCHVMSRYVTLKYASTVTWRLSTVTWRLRHIFSRHVMSRYVTWRLTHIFFFMWQLPASTRHATSWNDKFTCAACVSCSHVQHVSVDTCTHVQHAFTCTTRIHMCNTHSHVQTYIHMCYVSVVHMCNMCQLCVHMCNMCQLCVHMCNMCQLCVHMCNMCQLCVTRHMVHMCNTHSHVQHVFICATCVSCVSVDIFTCATRIHMCNTHSHVQHVFICATCVSCVSVDIFTCATRIHMCNTQSHVQHCHCQLNMWTSVNWQMLLSTCVTRSIVTNMYESPLLTHAVVLMMLFLTHNWQIYMSHLFTLLGFFCQRQRVLESHTRRDLLEQHREHDKYIWVTSSHYSRHMLMATHDTCWWQHSSFAKDKKFLRVTREETSFAKDSWESPARKELFVKEALWLVGLSISRVLKMIGLFCRI